MKVKIKKRIKQIQQGEIPKGYKRTESGIVPLDWEIHTLSEHLTESRIPGTNGAVAKKLTVKLWNKGVFEKQEIHKGSESTTYYKRKSGQLIYSKLDFLNCAFGIIPEQLDGYESTQDMPCFDIKDIDPHYLLTYVTQRNFYTHFGMIADGGRKARRVGPEDMLSFPIVCPHLAEQQKIAEILSTQDKLIELNQRKIEELKKLKKYYLSKMFPQNGSNVPEIRFKGFTEPWEQRRLGECFDERTERSADGELIAVTINLGVVKASELNRHDNSSDDKSNYKVVRKNDIAYNSMRMWQGASGYSLYDGILSPAYTVAIPMENINSIFFSYLFKQTDMIHEFQINSQGLTSDTWNLKFPSFSLIKVKVPKIEEQQQIGAYFKNLDRIITLHRSKLKELKKQKKSLIQLLLTGIVRVKT